MGRPDALSRQADHLRGAEDNVDCTLLTPEVFKLRAMEAVMLKGEEAVFMEQIQQSDQYDDLVVKALKALDAGELRSNEWMHCRQDNNPPHESFVESDSRARMSYHNHPKSHLHAIT